MEQDSSLAVHSFALKRILRDLHELQEDPIPWASICIPNHANPYLLHGNIMIQDGPYKDVLIHVIVRLPTNYPLSPPAANIAPGHPFTRDFHEHVIGWNSTVGASICTDLLSNFQWFFNKFEVGGKPVVSGWSPVYTLSSILMQLQVFFADPDFPSWASSQLPTKEEVQKLKSDVKLFTYNIDVNDGIVKKTMVHSYYKPYPEFLNKGYDEPKPTTVKDVHAKSSAKPSAKLVCSDEVRAEVSSHSNPDEYNLIEAKKVSPKELKFEISNKLICPVTKKTILNTPMPTFGYPILIQTDDFNRLWPTPVIEIISKEGLEYYTRQPSQVSYFNTTGNYTSVFGQEYNLWLPLYINQKHFEQSKAEIYKVITEVYSQMTPEETTNGFLPKMVLKVFPPILVKTVIHILKGDLHQSLAALDAYCQFYWLFMKLINLHPELQEQVDAEVERFLHEEQFRHKRQVGDLGEFMFKLSLSKHGIYHKEINQALLAEFLARQVTWAKGRDIQLRRLGVAHLVRRFMKATTVACQFFLVQFETAKLMVNDSVKIELEEGYGVVNPAILAHFMKKVRWIRNKMKDDWRVLINNIGLAEIVPNEEKMQELLEMAFDKEEESYSKWSALKCSVSDICLNDSRCPGFGYIIHTYPNFIVDPNFVCDLAGVTKGVQWLPLYINKDHFERVRSVYNQHLLSIYRSMSVKNKEKDGNDISKIALRVFCHTLTSALEKLSVQRRVQMSMLRAYLHILWTFWKILEQNKKMRDYLDQEVELFRTQESFRKNLSWTEFREFSVKFILSEKTRGNLDLWYFFFEELVRKEATSAVGNLRPRDPQGFDCERFGKFNQDAIKLLLVQIRLTKVVLQDHYRAQFESKSGCLRGHEVDKIKQEVIGIYKERYYKLWKPALEVFDLKEIIKGHVEMSDITKELYRQAVASERQEAWMETKKKREESLKLFSQSIDAGLGLKFSVKRDTKKTQK